MVKTAARRSVAVIGAGRLGGAFGRLLAQAGYRVVAVAGRTRRSAAAGARFIGAGEATADAVAAAARAAIVLITVPDREIRGVCERIARGGALRRGTLVAHASGAHTRELLDAARAAGALRAVLHPLQAVPTRERGVAHIPGSFFRIEADRGARARVSALVRALGGIELSLPGWTGEPRSAALYHAGAVAASNYLVTLLDFAARLLGTLGVDRRLALRAVLPLVRGTLANVEGLGIPAALTGPIARGDAATVAGHVAALRQRAPELLALYRLLARETVPLARAKGLDGAAADALLRIVRE
ncbi:MAG TPA: Rossmann-like and DUF2520 domain-containing protein [Candidatus Methanoperedens sp.]|nr:Rossmann-like and DUF2520 domain-containing protein [Candidatus Methanoperedens sp.]